ncbi:hypothetical protein [Streptomyces sp. NPDC056304]|uniref:hypothetical protein n=1 Tax=Streptomyces sp. NPDC056304 TaxID=3345778 RepID=UPI0035E0AB30
MLTPQATSEYGALRHVCVGSPSSSAEVLRSTSLPYETSLAGSKNGPRPRGV